MKRAMGAPGSSSPPAAGVDCAGEEAATAEDLAGLRVSAVV